MRMIPIACAVALAATATTASRDGAAFDVSLAGVPIGGATLRIDRDGDRYALIAAGDFGFLFWGGAGEARAAGAIAGDALRPDTYRLSYQGVSEPGAVSIDFDAGRAVRWEREPPMPAKYANGRLPVEDHHLVGVLDPLSALVIPAPADVAPEALCRRVLPVFSGYTRFDLELVSAEFANDGGVQCATRYRPVAGHRAKSNGVERMRRPDALRIALAPIAPDFWGPSRVAVATRFGTLEIVRR